MKVKHSLAKKLIYTTPGQCELKLQPKKTYVLAGEIEGGRAWISSCNFAQPWAELAPKMKKGIKLLYKSGCDCPVRFSVKRSLNQFKKSISLDCVLPLVGKVPLRKLLLSLGNLSRRTRLPSTSWGG